MKLNEESTWPADVLQYLERYRDLFLDWEDRSPDSPQTTSPEEYDDALHGLRAVLNNHTLHGYHCTRLTIGEITHITSNGMQLPNGEMLRRRIQTIEDAGLIAKPAAREFANKNQADEPSRGNKI